VLGEAEWDARHHEWLPGESDEAFVQSLMQPVITQGQFASWIAPPSRGINGQPVEFAYVRLD
jgi:benzoyl-CoA 2,3-dioxygenase component B